MTVSEFSRSRPAAESSNGSRLRSAVRSSITRARSWLGKLVSFAFTRVLIVFVVGFAAGMVWQTHGGGVRQAIAGWSRHLAWVAPATTPGTSAERLKATSLALAAVRQSIDKLSAEIGKLQPDDGAPQRRRR